MSAYGIMTDRDKRTLNTFLELIILKRQNNNEPIRFLEVGIAGGDTARGVESYCATRNIAVDYVGVDLTACASPINGGLVLAGDSLFIHHKVTGKFDLILIDGAHDFTHVVMDILNYAVKCKRGGYVMLHDVNPTCQVEYTEKTDPGRICEVAKAISILGLRHDALHWNYLLESFDFNEGWGGLFVMTPKLYQMP